MTASLNLREYERHARECLPREIYDFYAGGAGDEITLRENEKAWERLRLRPRVLVEVGACDLATSVLGRTIGMPILTAPCALNRLAHPEGELAVARAVTAADTIQIVSTMSSIPLEEISAVAGGRCWFQLYCYRDRAITRDLVARAEAAGFTALCLTVDVPMGGRRERDVRNLFKIPPDVRLANLPTAVPDSQDNSRPMAYANARLDPGLTWDDVEWLRGLTKLPLVVKGVLTAEDARLAIEHGVAGIAVSNHGGRQLDTAVATCDALAEVRGAVGDDAELYVDGGIRRGTDVLKALALGARAVFIGRPYLWGLAVDGEAGVGRVLGLLREELRLAMALAGCARVKDISPGLVAARPGSAP